VVAAGLLAAVCFLLTGCLKIDIGLTVHSNDTVSGSAVLAIDRRVAALTGQTEDEIIRSMTENSATQLPPGARTERYTDETFIGVRVIFDNMSLSTFNSGSAGPEDLRILHADGQFRVTGSMDLSEVDLSSPGNQSLADSFQTRVAVTMPGRVIEHNGELDDRTVTWHPKAGERTDMRVVSEESSGFLGIDRLQPWHVVVALLGAGLCLVLVAAVVILVIWLVRRSRPATGSAEVPPPSAHSPAPTTDPTNPPPW
jgi:hypothetical protein